MTENAKETALESMNEAARAQGDIRIDCFGRAQSRHNADGSTNLGYPSRHCSICVHRILEDGRPCPGYYPHTIGPFKGNVCNDFMIGTPKVAESPPVSLPKATRPATKRFVFDGTKWTCSTCKYTSPSKETMKSHYRRTHLPLPDRTNEPNPRRKSPQLDAKFQGDDSGGLD